METTMDPKACIARILRAFAQDEQDELGVAIDDLREWFRKGGFAPHGWTRDECASFVTMAAHAHNTNGCL